MWNKEKDKEYKKLKRSGYTKEQLKKHFGEDIYDSNYLQKSEKLSFLKDYKSYLLTEIKITPEETEYIIKKEKSISYNDKYDYVINFEIDANKYVLILFYVISNNIHSYELLFTTTQQYIEYTIEMDNILSLPGKHFTDKEQEFLKKIVEKETNFDEVMKLMKSISYILLDIYTDYTSIDCFSIHSTDNPTKIKLYRNIIKDSFKNIKEKKIGDIFYYEFDLEDFD